MAKHGNTLAGWTACSIIMVAFLVGTVAVVMDNWYLFWIGGVGLAIVGVIVGRVMQGMGYGKEPRPAATPEHDSATTSASA